MTAHSSAVDKVHMLRLIFCPIVFVFFVCQVLALDSAKLSVIRPAMEDAVKAKQAAGIVTLVMEKGQLVHHEAVGMADITQRGPRLEKHFCPLGKSASMMFAASQSALSSEIPSRPFAGSAGTATSGK